jgi:hypothetical protein
MSGEDVDWFGDGSSGGNNGWNDGGNGASRRERSHGDRYGSAPYRRDHDRGRDERYNDNRGRDDRYSDNRGHDDDRRRRDRHGDDGSQETLSIPHGSVGLVIGRGGSTIRNLQESSGCRINVDRNSRGSDTQVRA